MDNGKPFRESRDADIPTVVRHFYHHAGWAQLMDTEMRGWKSIGAFEVLRFDTKVLESIINMVTDFGYNENDLQHQFADQ